MRCPGRRPFEFARRLAALGQFWIRIMTQQFQQYKRTSTPTLEVVSLDDIKLHAGVEGYDDYDALLMTLRDRATEAVGKRCKRELQAATWTLTLDSFPAEILIDKVPVASITSIAYTDSDGDAQTVTAVTGYQTDLNTLDGPASIKPAYGITWPATRSDTYGAVVVTFIAGYATAAAVPETIRHEIAMLTAEWFKHREGTTSLDVNTTPAGLEMLSALNDTGAYA